MVVHLRDHAVNAIDKGVTHRNAGSSGGSGRQRKSGWRSGQRASRHVPGIQCQKISHDGVERSAASGKSSQVALCGHRGRAWNTAVLALPFIGDEEEGFVLPNGPAERSAELVIVEPVLRVGRSIKEVASIKVLIADEFEEIAVPVVGS